MNGIISYIVTALVSGGLLTALVTGFLRRRETRATANKIDGETMDGYAKGWRGLAQEYKKNQEEQEAINRELRSEIEDMKKAIREQDEKNRRTVEEKDAQIADLKKRVAYLEEELEKAKVSSSKVDEAKDILHHSVDDNLDKLKEQT